MFGVDVLALKVTSKERILGRHTWEMLSRFAGVQVAPSSPLERLHKLFSADNAVNKINLSTKSCRAEDGSLWTIEEVKEIKLNMARDPKMNHEYLHPLGHQQFRDAAVRFLLGENSETIRKGMVVGVQTIGGTSGLRLALEFLFKQMGFKRFYISSPTSDDQTFVFSNHRRPIKFIKYPYWDSVTKSIDFEGMKETLERAETDSVVVLQMCGHNPTGCDPSKQQWMQIADIMQERGLFPLFDASYQGMSSGDPDEDAWPVRYFADNGFEFLCSQSFSSNLGLYNCRIGNLTFVTKDFKHISTILSESTWNFYNIYGTPAQHGAKIVLAFLDDPLLRSKWFSSLKLLNVRLDEIRRKLSKRLGNLNSVDNWSYLVDQTGLFSSLALTDDQVDYLRENHIYMEKDGIINVSALDINRIGYVATCIHQAMIKCPFDNINNNSLITANAYPE